MLPKELRKEFYLNAEDFVLRKTVNDFSNMVTNFDYKKILKKDVIKAFVEFSLAFDAMIKGMKRQRESNSEGNEIVRSGYQTQIEELMRSKERFYKNAGLIIVKNMNEVLKVDFETSKEQGTKMAQFKKRTKQIIDTLFKSLVMADLHSTVSELQSIIFSAILKFLEGENWTKALAKFQKETIKEQYFEFADLFAEALVGFKAAPMYDEWKAKVASLLSK